MLRVLPENGTLPTHPYPSLPIPTLRKHAEHRAGRKAQSSLEEEAYHRHHKERAVPNSGAALSSLHRVLRA